MLFSSRIHFKMSFIAVFKAEFSASLLQCSVSHDTSEIILICCFAPQNTFLLLLSMRCSNTKFIHRYWKPITDYSEWYLQKQIPIIPTNAVNYTWNPLICYITIISKVTNNRSQTSHLLFIFRYNNHTQNQNVCKQLNCT